MSWCASEERKFDKRDFFFSPLSESTRKKIQLDKVALYSVTDMKTADQISRLILSLVGPDVTITDATACIGGNVFSFCKFFKFVNAVECDKTRHDMLSSNLTVLNHRNVSTCCADYLTIMAELQQQVVFIDPPWGGPGYKKQVILDLSLSDVPLSQVCERLASLCSMVVMKLPTNFDIEKFESMVSVPVIRHTEFRKMLLLVVDYRNKDNDEFDEIADDLCKQLTIV